MSRRESWQLRLIGAWADVQVPLARLKPCPFTIGEHRAL